MSVDIEKLLEKPKLTGPEFMLRYVALTTAIGLAMDTIQRLDQDRFDAGVTVFDANGNPKVSGLRSASDMLCLTADAFAVAGKATMELADFMEENHDRFNGLDFGY